MLTVLGSAAFLSDKAKFNVGAAYAKLQSKLQPSVLGRSCILLIDGLYPRGWASPHGRGLPLQSSDRLSDLASG
jgi:hypothetical protein